MRVGVWGSCVVRRAWVACATAEGVCLACGCVAYMAYMAYGLGGWGPLYVAVWWRRRRGGGARACASRAFAKKTEKEKGENTKTPRPIYPYINFSLISNLSEEKA